MTVKELTTKEYPTFFQGYIESIDQTLKLREGMTETLQPVVDFFSNLTLEQGDLRYAPDKWSIKEVFQHMIDTERIFAYRLLRLGRGDGTPMSGFNQDLFIDRQGVDQKSMLELISEFVTTRRFTISVLGGFSDGDLEFIGTSSGAPLSARAAAFIILGHTNWHLNKIRELYL